MTRPLTTLDGQPLPRLGLGTWRLGESARDEESDVAAVHTALRLGYRVIDTAEMYGEGGAERVVGRALRQAAADGLPREQIGVVSKFYPHHAGADDLPRACQRSLERLGLQQIDLYLLHWRGHVPLAETVHGLLELQRRGLIRHWGVSNFDVDDMEELFAVPGGDGCAANQIYCSLGERGPEHALLPWLAARGVLPMAYSPVDQGALTGHRELSSLARPLGLTPAQLALAWVMRHDGVMAIPKASREAHQRENLQAADVRLDASTCQALDRLFPPPRRKTPLAML